MKLFKTNIIILIVICNVLLSQTTLFQQKDKIKPITKTISGSLAEVSDALHQLLILTDIQFENETDRKNIIFNINRTPIAPKNGEVGELFSYEKLDEDALAWTFDDESLREGRIGNIQKYLKDPSTGIMGMTKMSGPRSSGPILSADFEGSISLKSAGRSKTLMTFELVFLNGTIPCKSTGFLEKELFDFCNTILQTESLIVPLTIDDIRITTVQFFKNNGTELSEELGTSLFSKRIDTEINGERTIKKFAKTPKQLMALWKGSIKMMVTIVKTDKENETEVKPVFLYMAINTNHGKRRWEIYPTLGVLEEEFYQDLNELISNKNDQGGQDND